MRLLAAGAVVLAAVQQGGPEERVFLPDHDLELRIPEGWRKVRVEPPFVFRCEPSEASRVPTSLTVRHAELSVPASMEEFHREMEAYLEKEYPAFRTDSDRSFRHGERDAFRLTGSGERTEGNREVHVRTVVRGGPQEYFILEAAYAEADRDRFEGAILGMMDSFSVRRSAPGEREKAGEGAWIEFLNAGKAFPEDATEEEWHAFFVGRRRAGYRSQRLSREGEEYRFETELRLDLGEGGRNFIRCTGTFRPDGRRQTLDLTNEVEPPKRERRVFRATMTLEGGKATVERDLGGFHERREFSVPEGALIEEIDSCFRRGLSRAGKGDYLLWVLRPFDDEAFPEWIEVAAPERLRWKEEEREVTIAQVTARNGIRSHWYASDGHLLRTDSARAPLSLEACTREEALRNP